MSIALMRWIGHWGAAIGTAVSMLLGHGLMMNRFYARNIRLDIRRMFGRIFRPSLPPALMAILLCLPLTLLPRTWLCFSMQCMAFMAVYALLLFLCNHKQKG